MTSLRTCWARALAHRPTLAAALAEGSIEAPGGEPKNAEGAPSPPELSPDQVADLLFGDLGSETSPFDPAALADALFGDLELGGTSSAPSASKRPLPAMVDLWLARDAGAMSLALAVLGSGRVPVPDRAPLAVVHGDVAGEVFQAALPPGAWPASAVRLSAAPEEAMWEVRETPGMMAVLTTNHPCVPADLMIVVWPLLAGLGPEALPRDELHSRPVRRTVWLEPCVGRIAAMDLQATLAAGLPGQATRVALFGAAHTGRYGLETDRTPPLIALQRQLAGLTRVQPRPLVVVAP